MGRTAVSIQNPKVDWEHLLDWEECTREHHSLPKSVIVSCHLFTMKKGFFLWILSATVAVLASLTENDVGYLLHITDTHLDLEYAVGSPTQCVLGSTGLRCCRNYDVPLPKSQPASKWGDYLCDSPLSLLNASLKWVNQSLAIDLVVWTGDSVDHHDVTQSWPRNRAEMQITTDLIEHYLPGVPVLACLGNHDAWPIDQLWPNLTSQIYLPQVAKMWSAWLTDENVKTFSEGGYYSQLLAPGQRVMVMNSLFFDKNNLALCGDANQTDFAGQWGWMVSTLDTARQNNEKVWIVGHIPPGSSESIFWFSALFQTLVAEYQDVISSQFWGHSHLDEVRFMRDLGGNVVSLAYIAPSLMPDNHYPAVRRYLYNKTTGVILDYEQYWLNFTAQLDSPSVFLNYSLGYSAKDAYQMQDLTVSAWADLDSRFRQNRTLLQRYYAFNKPNTTRQICDAECELDLLCDIEYVVDADHALCLGNPP